MNYLNFEKENDDDLGKDISDDEESDEKQPDENPQLPQDHDNIDTGNSLSAIMKKKQPNFILDGIKKGVNLKKPPQENNNNPNKKPTKKLSFLDAIKNNNKQLKKPTEKSFQTKNKDSYDKDSLMTNSSWFKNIHKYANDDNFNKTNDPNNKDNQGADDDEWMD